MKLELHLDWKRTVKTIMTMRGLSNSDLAQAAGTTDATMRQVLNKSVKGAVMPYHLHMPSYFLETFTEYP